MAIPGLTYRIEKESSLTHLEMDNNFRSVIYSGSIHEDGTILQLHYDTSDDNDTIIIPLQSNEGSTTVLNAGENRILTVLDSNGQITAESNFLYDESSKKLTIADGRIAISYLNNNIYIGDESGEAIDSGLDNLAIGEKTLKYSVVGSYNTVLGNKALESGVTVDKNVAVGYKGLQTLTSGVKNVSIGDAAGVNVTSGNGNIYIGSMAGPSTQTSQSDKLYINNSQSDTPLILGDFSTQQINFAGGVTGSSFTGSFVGDGSGLTGIAVVGEWDGSLNGNADITGSLIVSGTQATVDFTNVVSISGSIFSGSFIGDGSGLTGITADTFPYTGSAIISGSLNVEDSTILSGSATVTGSFTVHGPSDLNGVVVVDRNIDITNGTREGFDNNTNIGIGYEALQHGGIRTYGNNQTSPSTANTAIGYGSLTGKRYTTFDTQIGRYIPSSRSNFYYNTAIGYKSQGDNCIVGTSNTSLGAYSLFHGGIGYNTSIGSYSMQACNRRSQHSAAVGYGALRYIDFGTGNTAVGSYSLYDLNNGTQNVAIGYQALRYLKANTSGQGNTIEYSNNPINNTAIGNRAGICLTNGDCNVFIGSNAGPTSPTGVDNKLYINNQASANPLILGDFSTGDVTINNTVSASFFSGSFEGNGSGLTGVEWDGSRNGNADITGSLVVSGSNVKVDLTNTLAISGSTFSGSFVGDGSGLTGITGIEWDGSRNGNADITGSLIVSGALDVTNTVTVSSTGYPGSPGVELIHFHSASLAGVHTLYSFPISSNGYTGFKADYSLSSADESQKKIGTLLGSWDSTGGGEVINDSHTTATGNITGTAFSVESDGSNALLKLNAATGTYNINLLLTAFKKQV